MRIICAIVATLVFSGAAMAQVAKDSAGARPWSESISFDFFLSTAYVYNANNPDSLKNAYRVFDFDDNSFKVDVMEIVMKKDIVNAGDAGFRFDLEAGSSVPRIVRSSGFNCGDLDFHQLYLSYLTPVGNGIRLDAGKFITPVGYEVIEGYDNFNDEYSHSFLFGYAIPYTHTGVKASYSFNSGLSALFMVVNGWDDAIDNNKSKTLGAQIGAAPLSGMNLSLGLLYGPEQANNNADNRTLLDVVCSYAVGNSMTLGFNGDYGTEQHLAADGSTASWIGGAGYLKYKFQSDLSLAFRVEQFDDRDGTRTGVIQKLREATIAPEYLPTDHFAVRADFRLDGSDQNVFEKRGAATNSQPTIGVNVLFWM
jgi:hypothetical protein